MLHGPRTDASQTGYRLELLFPRELERQHRQFRYKITRQHSLWHSRFYHTFRQNMRSVTKTNPIVHRLNKPNPQRSRRAPAAQSSLPKGRIRPAHAIHRQIRQAASPSTAPESEAMAGRRQGGRLPPPQPPATRTPRNQVGSLRSAVSTVWRCEGWLLYWCSVDAGTVWINLVAYDAYDEAAYFFVEWLDMPIDSHLPMIFDTIFTEDK